MVVDKLYQLEEMLCDNIYQHGVSTYNITEYSKMSGKRDYKVGMLELELEDNDEVVFFDDEENSLLNNNCILRCFLVSSIENIRLNKKRIVIDFSNGNYVIIKPMYKAA